MSTTFALLLTDVVDSTQLNSTLGDAVMGPLWRQHDEHARALMQRWRGREIGRSDGFLVLFDSAADAVGFALAYHLALAQMSVPMQARVGIHVGEITLRENSAEDRARGAPPAELDGVALPAAARVMAAAMGRQTLLSDAARAALGDTPHRVQSHGHWRFKGLLEAMEVFEVGAADAPFEPPPDSAKAYCVVRSGEHWVPRREVRHSLPAERDAFIGRHEPLQQLAQRLSEGVRLLSLIGIGGIGKTRLATHFGWRWLGEFTGGVWFCDLSQARSLHGIAHAVAKGLELPLGRRDAFEDIGRALASRGHCLVILDNFEQVARHAGQVLSPWLDRAREAQFLVTTREVLGLPGEEVMNLAPLQAGESVAMFMQRAVAAVRDFRPTVEDSDAIEPLVRLLDGLPLAIELSAVRVRVMTPRMLLARMDERFQLLAASGARRDRQATLRNTFDWSWDLLSPAEKAALAQLSVFDGGFTLAAVESVLSVALQPAVWVVDLVQALVEKSLVRKLDTTRFALLRSVQEYAAEHLVTPGRFEGSGPAALAQAQARHWGYYAAFDEAAALADAGADADNLAIACRRAAAAGQASIAVNALAALWLVLRMTGPFRAAIELAQLVGPLPTLQERDQALLDLVVGGASYLLGDQTVARARLEAGLLHAENAKDPALQVRLLCALGDLRMTVGELELASLALLQAQQGARKLYDARLEYVVLSGLGALAFEQGELATARGHYEAALALAERAHDSRWMGGLLSNLGAVAYSEGRLDDAGRLYLHALTLVGNVGDRRWEGGARCNLALLHHEQGRNELALEQFEAALTMSRELGHAQLECTVLCNLGIVHEALGQLELARTRHEAALAAVTALGDRRSEGQFRGYLGLVYAKLGHIGQARDCLEVGEALLRSGADTLSLALLLCSRVQCECLGGDVAMARQLLAQAQRIAGATLVAPESELGRTLAAANDAVKNYCDVADVAATANRG
jgi:predicted ATPase/class 3 adenylate cyclase